MKQNIFYVPLSVVFYHVFYAPRKIILAISQQTGKRVESMQKYVSALAYLHLQFQMFPRDTEVEEATLKHVGIFKRIKSEFSGKWIIPEASHSWQENNLYFCDKFEKFVAARFESLNIRQISNSWKKINNRYRLMLQESMLWSADEWLLLTREYFLILCCHNLSFPFSELFQQS